MDTFKSLKRYSIEKVIREYPSHIIPIFDIHKNTSLSYKSIERTLKEIGYNITKRQVSNRKVLLSIDRRELNESREQDF